MESKNICKFTSNYDIDKINVICFIYESDHEIMKREQHLSNNTALLVKSGKGIFSFGNKKYPVKTGSLIFAFNGEVFSAMPENNLEYMYIQFSGARCGTLFNRFGINPSNRVFENFEGSVPLWLDAVLRTEEANIDLAGEAILLHTFSRLNNELLKKDSLVNQIITLTEKYFSDSTLSISKIAEHLSYNPKYLSHIFKKEMGMNYSEYLNNSRINYAVSLFNHGVDSVKNVAFLSGFNDPLYFSSVFKKTTGVSPKEYKERQA